MNRPRIVTYVFGNPLSCLLILFLTGKLFYQIQINPPDRDSVTLINILLLVAMTMAVGSLMSCWKLYRYKCWKKSLNPVVEDPSKKAQRRRNNLLIIGSVVWCALVYWLFFVPSASDYEQLHEIASSGFVVSTIIALLWFAFRFSPVIKARRKSREDEKASNYVVRTSLSVPRSSPKAQHIASSLPSYCQSLLAQKSQTD